MGKIWGRHFLRVQCAVPTYVQLCYVTLCAVPTYERKVTIKMYEELWNKMRDFIRSVTNSDNYDEKYMKIKLDLDDDLAQENARTSWHGNNC